jgi:hypothetical protein
MLRAGVVETRYSEVAGGLFPITFAGIPPTITPSSLMLRVTTAPAATITPLAIVVPAVITLWAPNHTSSPIVIDASLRF